MNAIGETPSVPMPDTEDPGRRPLRRYLATCVAIVVVTVAVRTIWTGSLITHSRPDPADRAAAGLMLGVAIVTAGTFLLMTFAPARARRWGLPAVVGADEREALVVTGAYSTGYTVGAAATAMYGMLFDNMGVVALSLMMQAAFFVSVVWLNRKT